MAPELFQGNTYSCKVDVYAFGILLNEMQGRRSPFAGQSAAEIRQQVREPAHSSNVVGEYACVAGPGCEQCLCLAGSRIEVLLVRVVWFTALALCRN